MVCMAAGAIGSGPNSGCAPYTLEIRDDCIATFRDCKVGLCASPHRWWYGCLPKANELGMPASLGSDLFWCIVADKSGAWLTGSWGWQPW
jgi:hypothetical protein